MKRSVWKQTMKEIREMEQAQDLDMAGNTRIGGGTPVHCQCVKHPPELTSNPQCLSTQTNECGELEHGMNT